MSMRDNLKSLLVKLKPGVPKTVLIMVGASVWAFAAYRILKIGISDIEKHALHHWLNYFVGFAGFVPFFTLVFRKVSKRYINRIIHHKHKNPCIFGFFDARGYLLMSLMIAAGILVSRIKMIPDLYKGTFFISLGSSLLASSVYFVLEGVKYVRTSGKNKKGSLPN